MSPRGRSPHGAMWVELKEDVLDPVPLHHPIGVVHPRACDEVPYARSFISPRVSEFEWVRNDKDCGMSDDE